MQLQKLLSQGRPSRYEPAVVSKIIREVREGASFNQACIAAGVSFVSLWRWKAKCPKFDKALRTARKQAVGKGRKVGEMPMSRDAFGRPFVSADLICDEPQRQKLIAIREARSAGRKPKIDKATRDWWHWLIAKRAKECGISFDAMVERLQHLAKLKEEFEAEQAQKKLGTGNVTATPPVLTAPATDSVSVRASPSGDSEAVVIDIHAEPESDAATEPSSAQVKRPEKPPAATSQADRPLVGGRSPLSWREPKKDENLGSL